MPDYQQPPDLITAARSWISTLRISRQNMVLQMYIPADFTRSGHRRNSGHGGQDIYIFSVMKPEQESLIPSF